MARPKPDPDMVKHAVDQVKAGRSQAEVATELRAMGYTVSASAVSKWCAAAGQASDPVRKAPDNLLATLQAKQDARKQPPAGPAPPVDATDLPGTLAGVVQTLLAKAHAIGAYDDKRHAELLRLAVAAVGDLRQLQKQAAEDIDTIKIPRAELEQAYRSLVVRVINPLRTREGLPPIEV